jgi:hypothetical protein
LGAHQRNLQGRLDDPSRRVAGNAVGVDLQRRTGIAADAGERDIDARVADEAIEFGALSHGLKDLAAGLASTLARVLKIVLVGKKAVSAASSRPSYSQPDRTLSEDGSWPASRSLPQHGNSRDS